MIGVTAAASAGIYLSRGYVEPGIAMPVMLGVLARSMLGARQPNRRSCSSFALDFCGGGGRDGDRDDREWRAEKLK
jgi:hypothetical protein